MQLKFWYSTNRRQVLYVITVAKAVVNFNYKEGQDLRVRIFKR